MSCTSSMRDTPTFIKLKSSFISPVSVEADKFMGLFDLHVKFWTDKNKNEARPQILGVVPLVSNLIVMRPVVSRMIK